MSEWQPIETAPRDGTYVLLYFPAHLRFDEYKYPQWWLIGKWTEDIFSDEGSGRWIGPYSDGFSCNLINVAGPDASPTHWMSLPEPPK